MPPFREYYPEYAAILVALSLLFIILTATPVE